MGGGSKDPGDLPSWQAEGMTHLDLREVMESGELPYLRVMEALATKQAAERMCFHCLYVPLSLTMQLVEMGYAAETRRSGPEHWLLLVQ